MAGGVIAAFRALPAQLQLLLVAGAGFVAGVAVATTDDPGIDVSAGPGGTTTAPATTVPATTSTPTSTTVPPGLPDGEDTTVSRVTDGDTLVVADGRSVRLIGIDTPETVDPRADVECFGPEAAARLRELVPAGTGVRLVYDAERTDGFGRTLAYVYRRRDGLHLNVEMARDGYAQQETVVPNVARADEVRGAVAEARAAGRGLWGACPTATTATSSTTVRATTTTAAAPVGTVTTTAPAPGEDCHPSYVGACVPVGVSDVDCAGGSGNGPYYVDVRGFRVVGPDPYRLDSDNDGLACES